ncbi:MAG: 50S ribosomal protein L25/general stress protein Ctc [Pseudomonadota bacterium]
MAEGFALKADVRERTGKGAARALRRNGQIPAVIYGNNEPPLPIAVPFKEMTLALYGGGFLTNIWQIDVGGQKVQALARDFQREPVKDKLVHIDFLRVTAKSRVTVDVPLTVVGEDESPGVSAGGVVNQVEFTVSVEAPAAAIPDTLEISIATADVGDAVMSDNITLPDGVTLSGDEPITVVTIAAPAGGVSEEDDAAGADSEGEAPAEGDSNSES